VAAADGFELPLGRNRALHAFASKHGTSDPTLGYRVLETRKHLRPEFAGLAQDEIRARVMALGRDTVMEEHRHVIFAHSGDSMPLGADLVRDADLLVHDATFLEPGDRRWDIHASSLEVFALAREAGVKCLLLHHLSIRYERSDALPVLRAQLAASGFEGDCWLLDEGRLVSLGARG
jgi:ribonuclease Z